MVPKLGRTGISPLNLSKMPEVSPLIEKITSLQGRLEDLSPNITMKDGLRHVIINQPDGAREKVREICQIEGEIRVMNIPRSETKLQGRLFGLLKEARNYKRDYFNLPKYVITITPQNN